MSVKNAATNLLRGKDDKQMPIAFLGIASGKIGENYKCEFVRECGKQRRTDYEKNNAIRICVFALVFICVLCI